MPAEIARHSAEELEEFRRLPFTEVCFRVVRPFATPDVPEEMLWQIVAEAINFPVKLVSLSPALHVLELFHGPTLAFKDFGARFMARLMGYFVRAESRTLTVLVATSGDTGSAVAHGFLRVPGIRVVILYPSKRIREAHRLAGGKIHRRHQRQRRGAGILAKRGVSSSPGRRYVLQRDGCGQSQQFSATAGFMPQSPGIRAPGNLGTQRHRRRNFEPD